MDIPVYLFTGFMDSGKTSFILQTLLDEDFAEGRSLVICCEDGEEEYDQELFERYKVEVIVLMLEEEEELTEEFLKNCALNYRPDQVFIEYNGTWQASTILNAKMPEGWELVQQIANVDASTYEVYLNNMRMMMMEQLFSADLVIFNRCTSETPKGMFRRTVKARNRKAQCVYLLEDGSIDDSDMDELPYDVDQDEIEILDEDYGLFYLDALENPQTYEGKKVKFLGLVYRPESKFGKKPLFVVGRFAMTCCVEDIQFIGFKCKYDKAAGLEHRGWINITAEIRNEFAKEYRGKGPVLYAVDVEETQAPAEEVVYFN